MKALHVLIGLLACVSFITAFHATVEDKYTSKYCIIMDAEANGTITYKTTENKTETFNFTISALHDSYGKCFDEPSGLTSESIVLEFYPNNIKPKTNDTEPWKLAVTFNEGSNSDKKSYFLENYTLYAEFYPEYFEHVDNQSHIYTKSNKSGSVLSRDKNIGYSCKEFKLLLDENSKIVFEHLKVAAFGQFDSGNFTDNQKFLDCETHMNTPSHVLLIICVCSVVVTVLVVMAFLVIYRRRRTLEYNLFN